MKSTKILTILVAVLAIIGIGLFINVFGVDADDNEALSGPVSMVVSYSYWLFIAAVVITVLLSVWSLIKNPAALKKTLLGLAVLGVLFAISYVMASDGLVLGANGEALVGGEAGGATSKWVSTGIWFSLILGLVGTGFFVWDLLKGLIKS